MAMGGSMTETTHASVRYTPRISASRSSAGTPAAAAQDRSLSCRPNSSAESAAEGRFAPSSVSQSTSASSASMAG